MHLAEALKCEIIKGYNIKKSEQGITDKIPDGILSNQTSSASVDSQILYRCKVWSAQNGSTLQKTINFALYEFLQKQGSGCAAVKFEPPPYSRDEE